MSSWDVSMSNHAGLVFNPIRTVSDNAKPSPSPKPIIKLSVGDPTLDKNLLTSAAQIKKLKEAIDSQECNGYFPTVGSPEAREAVATWWRNSFVHKEELKSTIVKDNVVLCSGGSHGILMAITAICDAGDYALVPQPGFPTTRRCARRTASACTFTIVGRRTTGRPTLTRSGGSRTIRRSCSL
ncbi:putative tyrosine aminotransferase [Trypanosoma cruzi]|uniref:Putative tyrosine aminotransferase n=1 Tax=Trypanosoma cruzi TaxID=5693 RepID=A0A2V2WCZ2_TRYCR|nr:putative tyrosine aminotransferase [Trypanosoma cruzi]